MNCEGRRKTAPLALPNVCASCRLSALLVSPLNPGQVGAQSVRFANWLESLKTDIYQGF